MNQNAPIGIFDSGIGGLTVANAIRLLMPQEKLIYFGDTAHLPYGDKSPDSIRYYAIRISKFLLDRGCKAIVIACNSASAVAFKALQDFFSDRTIVINAVDPLVKAIVSDKDIHTVGIIGTKATIQSGSYARILQQKASGLLTHSLATPLLAPMIEDQFHLRDVSTDIIASYLNELPLQELDALALACTHYPLIKDQISDLLVSHKIRILDSASPVATELKTRLLESGLLRVNDSEEDSEFYLSDKTESFEKSAEMFFGSSITINEADIFTGQI